MQGHEFEGSGGDPFDAGFFLKTFSDHCADERTDDGTGNEFRKPVDFYRDADAHIEGVKQSRVTQKSVLGI